VHALQISQLEQERAQAIQPRRHHGVVPRIGSTQHEKRQSRGAGEDLLHRRREARKGRIVDGRVGRRVARNTAHAGLQLDPLVIDRTPHVRHDVVDRVARKDAEIHDGGGSAREHVLLHAAVDDRDGGGRPQHRVERRLRGHHALEHGREQPEIREHGPEWNADLGRETLEEAARRTVDAARHGVALEFRERSGQDADRGVPRRRRGVAALDLDRERDPDGALLGDSDQRERRRDAGHRALHDRSALVERRLHRGATLREQLGDPQRSLLAPHLLVAAEGEQNRALGREALGEQPLDRLEDGKQAALVVHRAAAPHEAVCNHALEGRMLPLRFGARLHGYDVVMGEQQ
jgi:hypothetical protein